MIPVMNVSRQYASLQEELDKKALDILHSGAYILGNEVKSFEEAFAAYCGVKYAVGVANGSDALVIALTACGVKAGDEVITTAMSFSATAEAIAAVGAIPVFVDVRSDNYTIDASLISEKITDKTKAIIPVHIYGQCCQMDEINTIAKAHNLKVIEDAAQAVGSVHKGKKAGSMGDCGCFSFFPTKNLGACGDGGIITTDSEEIYRISMALRVHGSGDNGRYAYCKEKGLEFTEDFDYGGNLPKYYNYINGHNSRLDALQAGLLAVKLPHIDEWNAIRREYAKEYREGITNTNITHPVVTEDNTHIYYVYVVTVDDRADFRKYLEENDIGSGVYFPIPLHLAKVFEGLGYKEGDCPNAEYIANHGTAIPMFPELTDEERKKVIDTINKYGR